MSDPQVSKWNARYQFSGDSVPAPARVLSQGVRWLPAISDSSNNQPHALDLACGLAGNAHFLAERGYHVSAWDSSSAVIEKVCARKPAVIAEARVRDVVTHPPEPASFDIIVVSRFLHRAMCPAIAGALKPGGVLFYQTFVHGLSNPDYLLAPNELLTLFQSLQVLEYHEPAKDGDGKSEARLIARLGE